MLIREYEPADRRRVIDLWQHCNLLSSLNNPVRDIERKLRVDPDLFLVGESDNRIVATVMGGYEGHRGWINYLAVDPRFRRRGYGWQLMTRVETLLKEKGCPKINLQVRESNTGVLEFYKKIGFSDDHAISPGKRISRDEPFTL